MRFVDLDAIATPALRLSKGCQVLQLLKKKEHPTLKLKKAENLKFAKMFGEIGLDVLFGYTLRLETSRTRGCENVG